MVWEFGQSCSRDNFDDKAICTFRCVRFQSLRIILLASTQFCFLLVFPYHLPIFRTMLKHTMYKTMKRDEIALKLEQHGL